MATTERYGSRACRTDIEAVLTMKAKDGSLKYPYLTNWGIQAAIKTELGHTWNYQDVTTAVNDAPIVGGVEILWRLTGNGAEREFFASTTAPDTQRLWKDDLRRPMNELKRRLENRHLMAAKAGRVVKGDKKAVEHINVAVSDAHKALVNAIEQSDALVVVTKAKAAADAKAAKLEADKAKLVAEKKAAEAKAKEAAKLIAELEAKLKAAEAKNGASS